MLWNCGMGGAVEELEVEGRRAVRLSRHIRFYAYDPGHMFGPHYDDYNTVDGARTEFTVLVYLTGPQQGLKGGGTSFYSEHGEELLTFEPEAGTALLHQHGQACLLHEARPVEAGTKWVLRSDLIFE
eukprot:TRINITY_DN40605_c0_g1_i2.p1 TRINITY_DN40605_c0_g1~~TRINITY_DN40605_c0_g1_i2.p1  ORF type:complete len:127 (-),score=22.94 TRINITY_DN40605_c0_g1_i2:30-410(-)